MPKSAQNKSMSESSATLSKSPSPTATQAPTPTTLKGSGRKLRAHPEVNYRDLHLGRNLLLGRREFLKRMLIHSQICWESCPTHCGKSLKSRQRISSHLPTLIVLLYRLLKMSTGLTVPDPDPELMNEQNFDFCKTKTFLQKIGCFVAPPHIFTQESHSTLRLCSTPRKRSLWSTMSYLTNMKNLSSPLQNWSLMSAYQSSKAL